jgi:hypothetical protein
VSDGFGGVQTARVWVACQLEARAAAVSASRMASRVSCDLAVEFGVGDTPAGLLGAPQTVAPLPGDSPDRDCGKRRPRRGGAGSLAMPGNWLATAEAPTCCRQGH